MWRAWPAEAAFCATKSPQLNANDGWCIDRAVALVLVQHSLCCFMCAWRAISVCVFGFTEAILKYSRSLFSEVAKLFSAFASHRRWFFFFSSFCFVSFFSGCVPLGAFRLLCKKILCLGRTAQTVDDGKLIKCMGCGRVNQNTVADSSCLCRLCSCTPWKWCYIEGLKNGEKKKEIPTWEMIESGQQRALQ